MRGNYCLDFFNKTSIRTQKYFIIHDDTPSADSTESSDSEMDWPISTTNRLLYLTLKAWFFVTCNNAYNTHVMVRHIMLVHTTLSDARVINESKINKIREKLNSWQAEYVNTQHLLKLRIKHHEDVQRKYAIQRGETFKFTQKEIEKWMVNEDTILVRKAVELKTSIQNVMDQLDTLNNLETILTDQICSCVAAYQALLLSTHLEDLSGVFKQFDGRELSKTASACANTVSKFIDKIGPVSDELDSFQKDVKIELKEITSVRDVTSNAQTQVWKELLENAIVVHTDVEQEAPSTMKKINPTQALNMV